MSQPYKCYFEITKQAEALSDCVDVINTQENGIISFFRDAQPDEIIFIGCTSPYYIGKSAAYYWQSRLGVPTRAVTASEYLQFQENFHSPKAKKRLVVAISRSGKTSETIWALEAFRKRFSGKTFLISCAPDAPLVDLADYKIFLPMAMEETLAQTKSFSTMYLGALLASALISKHEAILEKLRQTPSLVDTILTQTKPTIEEIFSDHNYKNLFFLGSGPQHGIALDAALKMMEMSLSEVMCFPFLESRHGPKSIISENSLVIGLMTHAGLGHEALVIDEYTTKHRATTVALTPDLDWENGDPSYHLPVNFDWPDSILGLLYLPVIQLMAYYRAVSKDVNPDKSQNLSQFIQIPKAAANI